MGKDRTMDTYLLIKYLKCATTPEEEVRVRAWLADDPDGSHAKQYSDAHFLYEGMLIHGSGSRSFKAEAKTAGSGFRKVILAVASAAAVVLMIAGAGLWSRNVTYDRLSARMETVYVPAGKSMQLTLEDGTELWLNSGTEIEYPAVFSRKSRNVILHGGEVMFDVTHDEDRPFRVETFASSITVLGTKFNVSADAGTGDFSAALLRGSVRVDNKLQDNESCILAPNELVRMKDGHLYMERFGDPDAIECWTSGLIDVTGISFDRLMRKFELAYDVQIIIDRDDVPQIRYTRGKVRVSDGIEHALDMLSLACDFEYDYDRQTSTVIIR